jgi:flavin reductase (DIM6/NTAB) family NADH-FMN oxidoreductase RutF
MVGGEDTDLVPKVVHNFGRTFHIYYVNILVRVNTKLALFNFHNESKPFLVVGMAKTPRVKLVIKRAIIFNPIKILNVGGKFMSVHPISPPFYKVYHKFYLFSIGIAFFVKKCYNIFNKFKRRIPMRKNFGPKSWLYPMPVLIVATYDENGNPNAMNAAWGGIYDTNQVMVCLAHEHKTTENIKKTGAFTLSFATAETVAECDYVGIVSANDVPDKFERAGFHHTKSNFVNAPIIEELPMAIECRLISYDDESCTLIGEIVNLSADESILDEKGKISPDKLEPIIYDPVNHTYRKIGEVVGRAFKDGLKLRG